MATATLANITSVTVADSAATANTAVLRDSSAGIAVAQCLATELKTTGILTLSRVGKTASFTADAAGVLYGCDATSGAIVATLPLAAASTGRVYSFKKIDASGNAVTVTGAGSETIDGSNTLALSSQWAKTMVMSNGTSWETI